MTHPFLRDEFMQALAKIGKTAVEILEPERSRLQAQVTAVFGSGPGVPFYDHLKAAESLQIDSSWKLVDKILPERPVLVFFEETDDPSMFVLDSTTSLSDLAGATTGFQMYFVDSELRSLVALTSFDVLLASGNASAQLLSFLQSER